MTADNGAGGEAVEPPDEPGFHFAETDPSQRFGRFDQVLGRGAFKVVYKAFDTQEGTEVAWNQVRVSELLSSKDPENKEERDRLFAEIRVLKALKHKNIMSFYDSWYDPRTFTVSFITELFTSGTLRQYRKRHKHIDGEVLKRWAWQILCGLVYLHGHSPPIIHRDLKCDNIFINGSDGVVKIGDLGLATMLRSSTAPQSVLGTPEFMAPELYEEEYDDRVDVYSFGMCLLELSTMEYPYSECKNAAQIYRKVSLGIRPAALQKVASPELAEFVNLCISSREARPRARQLLKHPYFDSIRKDKLLTVRSDAALAAAGGGDAASDYGSAAASAAVSRTASSLADLVAASASGGHLAPSASAAPVLQGPPSAGSVTLPGHAALSRTASADVHSERAHSDAGSVRSQRSNASELAAAVALENIAEEEEGAGSGAATPTGGLRSQQASRRGSPRGDASPPKPGSPSGSEGCRCDATERRFAVRGDWLEVGKRVQLRLRICEPTGCARTVEFEFDLAVDTAADVAGEMVADLELTPEDAAVISTAIKDELERLSTQPQVDEHASQSLVKAARVLEHSLTTNALEQAHSGVPRDLLLPSGATSSRQLGRFSEQTCAPPPPSPVQLPPPRLANGAAGAAAALPPGVPVSGPPSRTPSDGQPSGRASMEGHAAAQPAALHRGSSGSSLASFCSTSSLPGCSEPAALAPAAQPHAPSLARASPPPRPPPVLAGAAEARPGPRPLSPLASGGANGSAPAGEYPSPSQRVLRSTSMDAVSLLSRTSALPPGREPVASPLGGSGALSPGSGVLSPAAPSGKRVPLSQVYLNLAEYQRLASSGQGLEAAMAAAAATALPPLPQPASGRPLAGSVSGGSLESGDVAAAAAGLMRPRSEASLVTMSGARPSRPSFSCVLPELAPGSAPMPAGGLAAAAALADHGQALASPSSSAYSATVSPRCSGGAAPAPLLVPAAAAEAVQRLDLQPGAAAAAAGLVPVAAPPALARVGAHALSAPPSKLPSRDASPCREREGSLSPTRAPADANGKRPLAKDKEALRRQAADAMKAVELRSLNLLEGGLGASRNTRGVPMAAVKSMASLCSGAAAPAAGIPAVPAPVLPPAVLPQPQLSHGSLPAVPAPAVAPPPLPPPPGAAAAAAAAAARPQLSSQAAAVLVPPPSAS